ncbi:hypothetical protein L202_05081 [Cryptococcus amylolentus CBS 6039]|uniref:Gamma-interferon-inducible lysosomal thiol reductase n=1 Tax=Cryptococcus amylolentus CBS 6039 TaxID=1295533 RepID=A0A1E3HNU1_9TREE|nr:hypothetical protein L202_05081 [Cryptococcus amylolentus CBS 6039]ODN77992.1 hypothetical protein L202_05081 [Cryptococcus amylolentus CBS 6039]
MRLAFTSLSALTTLAVTSAALLPPSGTSDGSVGSLLDTPDQLPFGHTPRLFAGEEDRERVNVTLYVMSRCPDARLCENTFGSVLRSPSVPSKINLSLQFIGSLNSSSSSPSSSSSLSSPSPWGVECKHGPKECVGNAHQLCLIQHLSGQGGGKGVEEWFGGVECMNFPSDWPERVGEIAEVERCAKASGAWDRVESCIVGSESEQGDAQKGEDGLYLTKEATKLLRDNVKKTEEAGVKTSCTIDIASTLVSGGRRTCVVDGGIWKGCDDGHTAADFVRVIEAEYKNLHSISQTTSQ